MSRDYNYNDLLNMQEQAVRRVEQMQSSAQKAKQSFSQSFSAPKNESSTRIEQKTQKTESNVIKDIPPLTKHNTPQTDNPPSMFSNENPIKSVIDGLNLDDDKLLLIGILILLSKEGADNSLIFSILYMLF